MAGLSIRELDYIADRVATVVLKQLKSEDVVLNTTQVADMLGVTRQDVTFKVRKGELPAVRKGNRYYFSRNELIKILTTNCSKS